MNQYLCRTCSKGSDALRWRFVSAALGLTSGLLALLAVLLQLDAWRRLETFRLPPVSQVGFFFGLAVFGMVAALAAVFAMHRGTTAKAIAMISIAGSFIIHGALGSAGGSQPAVVLLYAGLIGLVAGLIRATEAPRGPLAIAGGLLGSVAVAVGIHESIALISRAFP